MLNTRVAMSSDEHMLQCELLVVRLKRGDQSAFAPIVQMWERPLFYYLQRLAPSEADVWTGIELNPIAVVRSKARLSRNVSTYFAYGIRFQIRTGPSNAPLTRCLLSGVKTMDVTPLLCPRNISVELRDSRLQNLIVSSPLAVASIFPSGEKAAA
jgi:hypothetical protein